jgi:hypothetical protein
LLRFFAIPALLLLPVAVLVGWLVFKLLEIVGFTLLNFVLVAGSILLFFGVAAAMALVENAFCEFISATTRSIYEACRRSVLERRMPAVPRELKESLFREACLVATVLARLASEVRMEKELPVNVEVITRRVLLDKLRELGLRDALEPWLLDLLLAPDGHWTKEQKQRAKPAWECLAVLQWTLGLGELRSLTVNPGYSLSQVRNILSIEEPERLEVLAPWDLRLVRDRARRFVNRCWSELVARGLAEGVSKEDVSDAIQTRLAIQEAGYTCDYLVGTRTIPELDSGHLMFLLGRAYHRWQLLTLLVEINSGEVPVGRLRTFMAPFFSVAETEQPGS